MKKLLIYIIFILGACAAGSVFLELISLEQLSLIVKQRISWVAGAVYDQATIHNPVGDILPDQIDDILKSKIKKFVENLLAG
jgi:hypothetical protein